MTKICFSLMLISVLIASAAQATTDWDLNLAVERMSNRLLGDAPIDPEDIEEVFEKVLINKNEPPLTERKSDESYNSNESDATTTSHSSTEVVDAMEEFLDDFFEEPFRTTEQLQVRKEFINTLHYLEDKFPFYALQKGIKLIAEKLSN